MNRADPDFAAVKALFQTVCDAPDPLAALAAAAAPPAIAERVRVMLDAEGRQTTRFSKPVAQLLQDASQELHAGDRLGAWTLLQPLGQGGMGRVFLAERSDGHYQQRVAIKLLRGWSGDAALAQLARERQILAGLQHPHIARLIDGGSTPQGQPFLVMDFVEGERIDRYLAGRGSDDALRLFAQVGGAVAYAHRQLVVHCDLKPANVLVGADGRAMLLDFGIAQLQGVEPGAEVQAMTPRYASPEQRAGRPSSAATDIFSLGAMLAEMLQAAQAPRPFEWRAIVARACEPEPEHRYPSVDALLDDLARYRRHEPVRALPPAPGYLLGKALRRRWPWVLAGSGALLMAGGFTAQLVRQRDRAVAAETVAQHAAQQAEREAARAREQTRLALAAQTALREQRDRADQARADALGARNQATRERDAARAAERSEQAQRLAAQRAEQVAQTEATTTREVSDFLVGLFDAADLRKGGRADLPVSELVDQGTAQLDQRLADRPALRGRLQGVLARVQGNMGRLELACTHYEQAIALERASPQPDPLRLASLLSEQAVVLSLLNQSAPSVQAAREALALRQAQLPADAPAVAESWNALGLALHSAEAIDESRKAFAHSLSLRERPGVEPSLDVAITLHNLSLLERAAGKLDVAETLLRRAATIKARWLPEGHQDRINTDHMLVVLLGLMGRPREALPLLERVLDQQRRNTGEQSMRVANLRGELGVLLHDLERYDDARVQFEESLAVVKRLAPRTQQHARTLNNLAFLLADLGHPGAGPHYEESLAIRRANAGPQDATVRRAEINLGRWLVRGGQAERGEALLRLAETGAAQRLPPHHQDRIDIQIALALAELQRGQLDAAALRASELRAVESRMRPMRHAQWLSLLGLIASAQGRPAEGLARQREALASLARQSEGVAALQWRLQIELVLAAAAAGETETVRQAWPALRAQLAGQHPASPLRQQVAGLVETLGLPMP